MTCFRLARWCAIGVWLCFGLGGCAPSEGSRLDEQKEPHFLTGRKLVSQMDYEGAIDAFEKALEVNPRSASAHFELGCLYEAGDPAAAIYHYERVMKLSPRSSEAELAREHINSCKLELARNVSTLGPLPPSTQVQLEKILLENKELKAQLARWEPAYGAHAQAPTNSPAPTPVHPVPGPAPAETAHVSQTQSAQPLQLAAIHPSGTSALRTHTVKAGEYPATIARKYGVSVSALLTANPQAKPTRLQVGQVLNIPAS